MKIKPQFSLFLWTFICIFLVFWLGFDLWAAILNGEMQDLRTGNKLFLDSRPVWFCFVFVLKSLTIGGCLYFLYGVSQIVSVILKKTWRNK